MIRLGDLCVNRGEKKNGWLTVEKSDLKLPLTVLEGTEDGPVVVITSGLHGAEYIGIQTCMELSKELKAGCIRGTLVFVLVTSPTACYSYSRFVVPEDGKNLNRVFPGNADGTLSERIAYTVTDKLHRIADYYIDIHAGDTSEEVMPFVYFNGIGTQEVSRKAEEMAAAADMEIRVESTSRCGASSTASLSGIPSVLMERGGGGRYTRESVEFYKQDIRNILIHLKILDGREIHTKKQTAVRQATYIEAERDGLWYPALQPGIRFEKGTLLGVIKNVWGECLNCYYADYDGIVLYETVGMGVKKHDPLIAYGRIESS